MGKVGDRELPYVYASETTGDEELKIRGKVGDIELADVYTYETTGSHQLKDNLMRMEWLDTQNWQNYRCQ